MATAMAHANGRGRRCGAVGRSIDNTFTEVGPPDGLDRGGLGPEQAAEARADVRSSRHELAALPPDIAELSWATRATP